MEDTLFRKGVYIYTYTVIRKLWATHTTWMPMMPCDDSSNENTADKVRQQMLAPQTHNKEQC